MRTFRRGPDDDAFLLPPVPPAWRSADWPEVSVSIITYNQAHLVERAVRSVVGQRVDFSYEIVIGDDCSNDGTQDVLRRLQAEFPDRIVLILHPRRRSELAPGRINSVTNLHACRGRYTAFLDGDDYWTDPNKLQRQFDLLEAHPHLSFCAHNSWRSDSTTVLSTAELTAAEPLLSRTDHPTGCYTHAYAVDHNGPLAQISTVMYRTRIYGDLPDYYYGVAAADFLLFLLMSQRGHYYYDSVPRAVYYVHPASVARSVFRTRPVLEQLIADKNTYARHFPAIVGSRFAERRAHYNLLLIKADLRRADYPAAGRELLRMTRLYPRYTRWLVANFCSSRLGLGKLSPYVPREKPG